MVKELFEAKTNLGQVWTPSDVADRMVSLLMSDIGQPVETFKVLDPCVGPGTFLTPLLSAAAASEIPIEIDAVEIDAQILRSTERTFVNSAVRFVECNYLEFPGGTYDAVILNPPYIRHERIGLDAKDSYRRELRRLGMPIPGARSNLYVYFVLKAISELRHGGLMCAIVHGNLRTTAYGQQLWRAIRRHMNVIHSERLEVPFHGAMIDAEVFLARKRASELSDDQNIADLSVDSGSIAVEPGFAKIRDLLHVTRGTDLVSRRRFVRRDSTKNVPGSMPLVLRTPARNELLVEANASIVPDQEDGTLLPSRLRSARVIFNYYLRHSPRHLWNSSGATVSDNFLLLRSEEISDEALWLIMNSSIVADEIMRAAKPQGSGLRKLQVYQYRDISVPDWRRFGSDTLTEFSATARDLIDRNLEESSVREASDRLLKEAIV